MKRILTALILLGAAIQYNAQVTITSVSPTDATCNGSCDGSIMISATGLMPPLEYSMDGGTTWQASNTFSGLCVGAYTVWVQDLYYSPVSQGVNVLEPALLTATILSSTNVSCNGMCDGTANSTASGGTPPYTYQWNDPGTSTTSNLPSVCAGTYSLTVTDANGCTGNTNVVITEPSALVGTITGVDVACNGNCDGQGTISATGGAAPYSFQWDSGAGNQTSSTAIGLCAGTYSCTITDAIGCTTVENITINEPPVLTVSISGTDANCNGVCDGTASVTATGGVGGYTYSWDGGLGTTQNASGICAGSYNCTVTDANGCSTVQNIIINEPTALTVTASGTDATCNGVCDGTVSSTATGGVGGYTYNWDGGLGTSQNASGVCAGSYNITVTDANGCATVANITISEPALISVTETTADVTMCGGTDGSITITAAGGSGTFTYSIDGGSTFQASSTFTGLSVGSYQIVVDDGACQVNGNLATISGPAIPLAPTAGQDTAYCEGDAIAGLFASGAGGTLTWYSDAGLTNVIGSGSSYTPSSTPGSYVYYVTETSAGCEGASSSVSVDIYPADDASFNYSSAVYCQSAADPTPTITGDAGGTFTAGAGISINAVTGVINLGASTEGTYTITYTTSGSCQSSSTFDVTVTGGPSFTATTTDPSTCGVSDGSLNIAGLIASTAYQVTYTDEQGTNAATPMTTDGSGNIVISGLAPGSFTDILIDLNGCTTLDDSIYTLYDAAAVFIVEGGVTVTNTTCAYNDGSITGLVATGGTAPYTYMYNGVANATADLLNAQPGTYSLYAEDANGCSSTSSDFTIGSVASAITVSVSGNNTTCFAMCDGDLTAVATGGTAPYSYQWSNGQTGATANGMCAGMYNVTVIDANGCEGNAAGTVAEPASMTNTIATVDPSCAENNGEADAATTVGGTAPYSYQWSNGDFTATADSLSSGVYVVTVTDANGCIISESVNVTSALAPSISSNNTAPTCAGQSNGAIDLTIIGGTAPFSFDWSTGEQTEDISNLSAGIYDVTVIDATGCGLVEVITLPDSDPIDLSTSTITDASCGNTDGLIAVFASGGAGGYSYLWSSGGNTSIENNLAPGTYMLSVSDMNGCLGQASYTVSNAAGPVISVDQINQPTCQGGAGEVFVSITGGVTPYTYQWSDGSNNEDLLNAPVGNYELVVTDAAGCQGVEYAELIGVNFNAAAICMVTVDTTTGGNYVIWNKENNLGIAEYEVHRETSVLNVFQHLGTVPFDSLTQFLDTAANSGVHSYRYKLRTIDSCDNASDFLAFHKTIHLASNLGLNNTVNLAWDDYIGFDYSTFYINRYHPTTGWETIDSVAANVHSYTDNSYPSINGLEYGIEVRPNSPCTAEKAQDHNSTRSNRASIAGPGGPDAIAEEGVTDFRVVPNPANEIVNLIYSNELSNAQVVITDLQGKIINEITLKNNSLNTTIDISNYESGMYLIQVNADNNISTLKLIKQ